MNLPPRNPFPCWWTFGVVPSVLAITNILGQVLCGQGSHFCLGVSLRVELLGHGVGVDPTSLVLAADTGIYSRMQGSGGASGTPQSRCSLSLMALSSAHAHPPCAPTTNSALFAKSSCPLPFSPERPT